jgi:hypothetical protein
MVQILEDQETLFDDTVGTLALDVRNETDTAGVVFIGRVVESLGGRGGRDRSHGIPFAAASDVQRTKTSDCRSYSPHVVRSSRINGVRPPFLSVV